MIKISKVLPLISAEYIIKAKVTEGKVKEYVKIKAVLQTKSLNRATIVSCSVNQLTYKGKYNLELLEKLKNEEVGKTKNMSSLINVEVIGG